MTNQSVIAVIGHSYIRRLGRFIGDNPEYANLRLNENEFSVLIRGQGGLTVRGLAASKSLCSFSRPPDICFLQIGGNDVLSYAPDKIARDIISLTNFLIDGVGVKHMVIGQLIRRDPRKSPPGYNEAVVEVNKILDSVTTSLPNVTFWKHRGFWANLRYLGPDGVHLATKSYNNDPVPMVKYLNSIKYAVINTCRRLRPVYDS